MYAGGVNLNFGDEVRVVEENDAILVESEVIADHCTIINATLALLSHFFNVRAANTADESSLMGLGARVYNSAAAALYLTRSGYYQTALMLLRDLIESTNLLDYFLTHKTDIVKWRTLPEKQRRKLFDPAPIRDALQARDQLPRDLRKEYYALLSECAVHATFRGVNVLAKDGKRMVGPFSDRQLVEGVLSFLPLLVTFGAQVFLRHFDDVEDAEYLRALVTYNGIFLAWQQKHLPNAVFRDGQ
jgi:hypothetical protein